MAYSEQYYDSAVILPYSKKTGHMYVKSWLSCDVFAAIIPKLELEGNPNPIVP